MQVNELWRFPVKSMQGERLESANVDEFGIEGDRGWALFDAETDLALTARREPELLYAAAAVVDSELVITLPDGTVGADDAAISAWLGREVQVRRSDEAVAGTYETQADESETGEWFQWTGPTGSFHDSTRARVSLVSTEALRQWDKRRFRINVILDGSGDVELVGNQITLGTATVDVTKQIDRCIMTTRPQPANGDLAPLEKDLDVLRTINRENETFLGVGGLVVSSGVVAVGDQIGSGA